MTQVRQILIVTALVHGVCSVYFAYHVTIDGSIAFSQRRLPIDSRRVVPPVPLYTRLANSDFVFGISAYFKDRCVTQDYPLLES
ncbi:hypothetical protein BKA67DRAFT_98506 [Truncatella angustata]|uniref:Uncharacterized protein n=1 Tax=Truncatella angustata TaxID=152316 RepID=A0A9P8RN66_9PEZI|nr:uncharacterized protein BKA67DRAFT_98506 [Truncatella angustata]KAH6646300.1 hypothetical protein BKA67DRAFT_98506 [Truncatella angustata]